MVSAGSYHVVLHFAELTYTSSGRRVFDIYAQGVKVVSALDIYKRVGSRRALQVPLNIDAPKGTIRLDFRPTIGSAAVSAVDIEESGATLLRLNTGGTAVSDGFGKVWSRDQYYSGGKAVVQSVQLRSAKSPAGGMYADSRTGSSFRYRMPVPNGKYEVMLYFFENSLTPDTSARFDVLVEGKTVLHNLNVARDAGVQSPLMVPVETEVNDGALVIDFHASRGAAQIAAIEVTASSP